MDEYNDPDIVRVGSSFYSKSGVGSSAAQAQNSQRAMSLCIDPNQVVKSVVVRNISTSQKRFSLRSSFSRLTGRTDSLRSNKRHSRCEETILETNEALPRNSNDEATVAAEGKQNDPDEETEDLMKRSSVTVENEDQMNFWLFYFQRCGWMLIFVFSISSCFYQSLKIYSDLWLNEVVEENEDTREVNTFCLLCSIPLTRCAYFIYLVAPPIQLLHHPERALHPSGRSFRSFWPICGSQGQKVDPRRIG